MNSISVMLSLATLAIIFASASAQSDDETTLRFATMMDTTVYASHIEAVVTHSCSMKNSMKAATDPEKKCHTEALKICEQLGEAFGGYVIEPANAFVRDSSEDSSSVADVNFNGDNANNGGIIVKIVQKGAAEDVNNLVAVRGAVLFEKRTDILEEEKLLQLLEEKHNISKLIDQAIERNWEIQEIEQEISRRVQQANFPEQEMDLSKKYKNKTNRELSVLSAEIKASVVEGLVETMLSLVTTSSDSSGTILLDGTKSGELPEHKVPLVSCTPGSFTGGGATILGKTEYLRITPGSLPKYTPKTCTFSQYTPKLCACTAPTYTPRSCSGGLYLPGRHATYFPARFIPAKYEPAFCDIEYVEVSHPFSP